MINYLLPGKYPAWFAGEKRQNGKLRGRQMNSFSTKPYLMSTLIYLQIVYIYNPLFGRFGLVTFNNNPFDYRFNSGY